MNNKQLPIAGLLFDCDGLLCDTETPDYQAWVSLYADFGEQLPFELYSECIGSGNGFDPAEYLSTLTNRKDDYQRFVNTHGELLWSYCSKTALPGVTELVAEAQNFNLPICVVSSSPRTWVKRVLQTTGLDEAFNHIVCRDDVERTKPFPDLYLKGCQAINIEPSQGIAFEDSPHGVNAALAAGLKCVAVPNPTTIKMTFPQTSGYHKVSSLEQISVLGLTKFFALVQD